MPKGKGAGYSQQGLGRTRTSDTLIQRISLPRTGSLLELSFSFVPKEQYDSVYFLLANICLFIMTMGNKHSQQEGHMG